MLRQPLDDVILRLPEVPAPRRSAARAWPLPARQAAASEAPRLLQRAKPGPQRLAAGAAWQLMMTYSGRIAIPKRAHSAISSAIFSLFSISEDMKAAMYSRG